MKTGLLVWKVRLLDGVYDLAVALLYDYFELRASKNILASEILFEM